MIVVLFCYLILGALAYSVSSTIETEPLGDDGLTYVGLVKNCIFARFRWISRSLILSDSLKAPDVGGSSVGLCLYSFI